MSDDPCIACARKNKSCSQRLQYSSVPVCEQKFVFELTCCRDQLSSLVMIMAIICMFSFVMAMVFFMRMFTFPGLMAPCVYNMVAVPVMMNISW